MLWRWTERLLAISSDPRTSLKALLALLVLIIFIKLLTPSRYRWAFLQPWRLPSWLNQRRRRILLHLISMCFTTSVLLCFRSGVSSLKVIRYVNICIALMSFVWSSHVGSVSFQEWWKRYVLATTTSMSWLLSALAVFDDMMLCLMSMLIVVLRDDTHDLLWRCQTLLIQMTSLKSLSRSKAGHIFWSYLL